MRASLAWADPRAGGAQAPAWAIAGWLATVLAEASWIWVLYATLGVMAGGIGPLSLAVFAAVVAGAMIVGARTAEGADWSSALFIAVGLLAVGGIVVSAPALTRLLRPDPLGALAIHPGGVLVGLAAVRGVLRGRDVRIADQDGGGLGGPAILLVVCWLFGGTFLGADHATFRASATVPTLLFVLAGPAGAALGRVAGVARAQGRTASVDGTWLALLGAILLLAGGIAWIGSTATGRLDAIGPILIIVVAVAALNRRQAGKPRPGDAKALAVWFGLLIVVSAVALILHPQAIQPQDTVAGVATVGDPDAEGRPGGTILFLVGAAIVVALVALTLRRRRAARPLDGWAPEVVHKAPSATRGATRWSWPLGRRRSRSEPGDAVAAYRAALEELGRDPDTRRRLDETPGEHARRLRVEGSGGLALELLAADYELIRFGDRSLPAREQTRAHRRWEAIRAAARARLEAGMLARRTSSERTADGPMTEGESEETATKARAGRV